MKNLKFTLFAVALMVATMANAQLSLGVKGGINMSNLHESDGSKANAKIGFNVGLSADYEFAPSMALQTGLFFTTKGAKYKNELPKIGKIERTINAYYLQLPLHFAYKLDVTPGTRMVFHAGPYVAYGIGGKAKFKSKWVDAFSDIFGKPEINTFDKNYGIKPFDAGLGLGVGAEFGPFLVDLGWDMGLLNLSKNKDIKITNQNAYLSVGYRFN